MTEALQILVLCTANQCRSPMAQGLLAQRMPKALVSSAGSFEAGRPATASAVRVMAARGIDLAAHRSRRVTAELVRDADLVIGMTRAHVRNAVVEAPHAFRKTFTLRELVRRGERVGPAADLSEWLEVIGRDRRPLDLLGEDPDDDIADPIGRPDSEYEETAAVLGDLIDRLGRLLDPIAG